MRIEKCYGITKAEYDAIYEAQGGMCAVCGPKAKGKSKMLAVDHEHGKCDNHPPDIGCRNCVRCLACTTCNRIVLGRYSIDSLLRAVEVLLHPPAQKVLNHG